MSYKIKKIRRFSDKGDGDAPYHIYIIYIHTNVQYAYSKLMKLQQATDNESLWADPAKSDNEYDHHHVI